ncbi:MAG: sulfatase-like hydrolase/transferase [Verrucomicrobiales bacterium]
MSDPHGPDPEPTASRPNILFLFADDLSYEVLGFMGNREVATRMDALAAKGTVFTHTYNMGSWSGAVCVASRHMLNTGLSVCGGLKKHAAALGSGGRRKTDRATAPGPGEPNFKEKGWLWSQLMAAAGCRACFTGKWHVNADPKAIFFSKSGRCGQACPKDTKEGYNRPLEGLPVPGLPATRNSVEYWEGGTHWVRSLPMRPLDFWNLPARESPHFTMYVAFSTCDPRQAPSRKNRPLSGLKVAVP